ncbi:hypothetical protein OHT57_02060 [Streptomyces sp. NBC_00285]|uniref:hypothetical protein n=1 Tax=Streptomyces sp. NBC_00285 TaxID=2975700 RepID=UPI002E2913D9|nr:hypothetical protein [Streptomyces sp. NBC_00285]
MERKLDCMLCAGPNGDDSARFYPVFADLVLACSAMNASLASLSPEIRDADLRAWKTDYLTLSPKKFPTIASPTGRRPPPYGPSARPR